MSNKTEIFLDYNASHPMLASVREALAQNLLEDTRVFSNPMSVHARGRVAKRSVYDLKKALSEFFGVRDHEHFVLNSGATEGINAVMRGFHRDRSSQGRRPFLIHSTIEHSAVLDTRDDLSFEHHEIPVTQEGALCEEVLFERVSAVLDDEETDILLVLQVANNEIGSSFDFSFLQKIHQHFGPKLERHKPKLKGGKFPKTPQRIWVLLDAAQAFGKLPEERIRKAMAFADYMVLSAHKIGGPTGIGALWLNGSVPFASLVTGGAQEKKRRAGTHNALGIRGFCVAVNDWFQNGENYRKELRRQRQLLENELSQITGLHLHPNGEHSLCNTVNFHVEECREESLMVNLDLEGVCVSSGAACNSGSVKPSRVLLALSYPMEVALSSARVTLGVGTSDEEILDFVARLKTVVERIRKGNRLADEMLPELELSSAAEMN